MRALSAKLQKQSEELDRKLGKDNSKSLSSVVKNLKTTRRRTIRSAESSVVATGKGNGGKRGSTRNKNDRGMQTKVVGKTKRKDKLTEDDSDDQSTESDNSCKYYHNDLRGSFKEESDARYFEEGFDMYGSKCSICKVKLNVIEEGKCFVVGRKHSVWICIGRNKYQCKHALCQDCYNNRVETVGGRGKRKRKALTEATKRIATRKK